MLHIFFDNMALMFTFIFLALKLKHWLVEKKLDDVIWSIPLMFSLLSVLVMIQSYAYHNLQYDLRSVPIFLISYIGGWKLGITSAILPTVFIYFTGGSMFINELILTIFIPVIIGAIFHQRFKLSVNLLNIKKLVYTFVLLSIIQVIGGLIIIDFPLLFWLKIKISMTIFSLLSILGISLMINDANYQYLYRKKLEYQSSHDLKTDLTNLQYFKEYTSRIIQENKLITIAMIDIDYFKRFNDTNGHQAGDQLLIQLAEILKNSIRDKDLIGRYGGEEFILMLQDISQETVELITERIRSQVEIFNFKITNGEKTTYHNITISIGFSYSDGNKTLDQLIEEADKALYDSKRRGRNLVSYYNAG